MKMILTLKGKTAKGKNVIKRDGEKFVVVRETNDNRLDIEPVDNPRMWRLIKKENDPNFEIISTQY